MSKTATANLISTLAMYFVPIRHESDAHEAEWLRAMSKALEGYSQDVLERTTQRIINTRKNKYFPLPAEIRQVADDFIEADNARRMPVDMPGETAPIWSRERQRLADQLVKTEQGRRAAREGWVLGLWHHIVEHGRAPVPAEEQRLKQATEEANEAWRLCLRGAAGPMSEPLAKLGSTMADRRKELADRVLGE